MHFFKLIKFRISIKVLPCMICYLFAHLHLHLHYHYIHSHVAGKQDRICMYAKSKPLYIANCNKLYVIQTTSPVPRTELVPATRPLSENWSSAIIYRTFGNLFNKHTTRSHIPLFFFFFLS
ncbi:hypothetical protein ALC57_07947 [Trachymyrmex cornetzi]|uniref:Uncharacterized protein n=1 Tax=Trachymyrmex cornetzi TaxID=471704 RepID=A0A151J7H4_9HYME|nr:hypothetical protein ALC57_07947 [Trachymyrmex cornetzi]